MTKDGNLDLDLLATDKFHISGLTLVCFVLRQSVFFRHQHDAKKKLCIDSMEIAELLFAGDCHMMTKNMHFVILVRDRMFSK